MRYAPRGMSDTARAAEHAHLIRAVHSAAGFLGLDDDIYRDVLEAHTGRRSSKECTVVELKKLMEHFHTAGYPRPGGPDRRPLSPRARKIWSLWQQLADAERVHDRTMRGLLAWVAHHTNNQVRQLQWLTDPQIDALIEALKRWLARP